MNTSLVTAAEFDEEVGLRIQGDVRLSAYSGLPLDSGIPGNTSPVYSALGTLVDLTDTHSLLRGIFNLDQLKNSTQSVFNGATLQVSNPRNLLFDSVFRTVNHQNKDLLVALSGNIGWSEAEMESHSVINIGETPQTFPDGQFCIGAYYSYAYIQSIRSTIRVSTGLNLIGRRGSVKPVSTKPRGYVLLSTHEYLTETDITVPSEAIMMVAKFWGGGGGTDVVGNRVATGGAGGFTKQGWLLNGSGSPSWAKYWMPGATFRVVVGAGGADLSGTVAGFGGAKAGASRAGGGLSGLFLSHGAVTSSQLSRMIACAGGGGGGKVFNDTAFAGGNGNAAIVRHQSTPLANASMLGAPATSDTSGGGGGRTPGTTTVAGNGGSGFYHFHENLAFPPHIWMMWGDAFAQSQGAAAGPVPAPAAADPDYLAGYGGAGQPGRVVIRYYKIG